MLSVLAFAPLLISVFLVQLGVGVLGPLDALTADYEGFSTREIGLLGAAHFAGFFIGCIVTPALVARTGHARAFIAVASVGVIATLLHPIFVDPHVWMGLRVGAGVAVAGGYTVVESWLQSKVKNAERGRVLGVYRVVDLTGAIGSQLLIIGLSPGDYLAYNIVAMLAVLSLLPLTLTTATPPASPRRPRLRPFRAALLSPLATAGVIAVGLTNSSFRMIGPIYGSEFALTREEIAYFLAAGLFGGAAAQPVIGWLADRLDRRHVMIGVSAAALIVCGALGAGLTPVDGSSLAIAAFCFGLVAFPLYSISAAHANDFCPPDFVVELNASLIFFFAVGAVIGPIASAELIAAYGPDAMWLFIACVHAGLVAFGLYRMTRRPTRAERQPYRYLPRTSIILGRLFKRSDAPADADARGPGPAPVPAPEPEPEPKLAPEPERRV